MKAILWREAKVALNSPLSILGQIMAPIFLLVMFSTAFAGNIGSINVDGHEIAYVDYFAPGIFGYVTFLLFTLSFAFMRLDRQSGMLSIIALSPSSLTGYYFGKLTIQYLVTILKIAVLAFIVLLIVEHPPYLTAANLPLFVIALFAGVTVWLSLGVVAAVFIRRDDVREIVIMLVMLPFTFGSSMYYNLEFVPKVVRWVATINPLTYTCNVLRATYLDVFPEGFMTDLWILLGIAVVSVVLALLSLKKIRF